MGTIQQALQDVGYQPTIRPRDIRRAQEREDITQALHNFLDGVMGPFHQGSQCSGSTMWFSLPSEVRRSG